jgi:KDO2-lipid IV(A) lauroyltransferase
MGLVFGHMLRLLGFRRKVLWENFRRAYPEASADFLKDLERKNYRHYGCLLIEFLRSFSGFGRFLDRHCEIEGEENLRSALRGGKGVLVMTAHYGNWEVLPSHGSHVLKVPVTMVTKRLKPAWFHDLAESTRARLGTRMAYEPRTLQTVLHALRRGEIVGFAIDQFAGSPVGARVPFFGIPVGTNTVLAVLAQRTEAPVVPGFALRLPGGRFRVVFFPALEPVAGKDAASIIAATASYNRVVENWVRLHPEQWMWVHRRWKGDLSPLAPGSVGEMMKPD